MVQNSPYTKLKINMTNSIFVGNNMMMMMIVNSFGQVNRAVKL